MKKRNLVRICAWCKKKIGEKEPLSDKSVTHGMCLKCMKKVKEEYELEKEGNGKGKNLKKRFRKISHKTPRNKLKRNAKNPKTKSNSPVIIYDRLMRIEAQKGSHSMFPGEKYYHNFKGSTDAKVLGMPDGSLRIVSTKGKRLWDKFNY